MIKPFDKIIGISNDYSYLDFYSHEIDGKFYGISGRIYHTIEEYNENSLINKPLYEQPNVQLWKELKLKISNLQVSELFDKKIILEIIQKIDETNEYYSKNLKDINILTLKSKLEKLNGDLSVFAFMELQKNIIADINKIIKLIE